MVSPPPLARLSESAAAAGPWRTRAAALGALGREERLEDLGQHLRRDARAGVGNSDAHAFAAGRAVVAALQSGCFDLDAQASALGHGVTRVQREIEQGRFHLAAVDVDLGHVRADLAHQLDVGAQGAAQQFLHAAHQFGRVERFGRQRLAAGKGEHALGQFGTLLAGAHGRFPALPRDPVVADLVFEQLQAAHRHGQQIVEVVGHAAGQLADRFQLLGAQQSCFA